jgi:hypothetical protein
MFREVAVEIWRNRADNFVEKNFHSGIDALGRRSGNPRIPGKDEPGSTG